MTRRTLTPALLMVAALGGCNVAGESVFSSTFGEATANNMISQLAYANLEGRLVALNDRFQREATDTVNFDFNRSRLDGTARAALDSQVAWLKANPDVRMTVVGHTDAVGSNAYNARLGLRRARAVVRYMVRKGIDRDRLIAAESRGETELLVPTDDRERRNRRTVTMVAGFTRGYVGDGLDGVYANNVYNVYRNASTTIEVDAASSTGTGG